MCTGLDGNGLDSVGDSDPVVWISMGVLGLSTATSCLAMMAAVGGFLAAALAGGLP